MKANSRLRNYDRMKMLFDEKGTVSDDDIFIEFQGSPVGQMLHMLKSMGYVVVTLDGMYRKEKEFPQEYRELSNEYRGKEGPKALRLRAFRHPEEFETTSMQVGGSHYRKYKCQPTVFSVAANLTGVQLLILKYILRYKDKNGLGDLRKAKHLCDMCIELKHVKPVDKDRLYLVGEFIKLNGLEGLIAEMAEAICVCNWPKVASGIEALEAEYEKP